MKKIIVLLLCFVVLTISLANATDFGWKDPRTENLFATQNFIYSGIGLGAGVGSFYFLNRTVGLPYKVSEILSVVAVTSGAYAFEDRFSRFNDRQQGASWVKFAFASTGATVGVLIFAYDKPAKKIAVTPTGNGFIFSYKF